MEYIAEIGWNFMGDMKLAEDMIAAAAQSGATTAKFQYWNPEKLKAGAWDNDGRREIYNKACLNADKIQQLTELCSKHNVKFLLSVFNKEDAEFVSQFSTEAIKIPSHEVANIELIRYALSTYKRVFLSLGACTEEELKDVSELVGSIRSNGEDVVAMHCVSSYPCPVEKVNLPRMAELQKLFNGELGLSDHSQSVNVPAYAVAMGATVIEKHFTVNHDLPGRDNKFAVLPEGFEAMVANCQEAKSALIFHGVSAQDIEQDTMNNYRGRWG
ncbi:N-acetylneuraminate synthase family protein [Neptuniibacter caesariensis]|uniref:N-acetylneuraminic acid synthetase n=1 Tax=Neptuniibacter caesariensis TaxID=207954 RepID=A0A7U8C4B8_NEPCE|nr:N-acetylneuraminate synthase family protein [Neptuniibacter caesariensis]EAR60526.1 N-acetylneuraminic acid synthetase [Oceanospirillum sp. MED92] [Neptuniibacter caesariensis]